MGNRQPDARRAFPRFARTYFTLLRHLERRPIRIDEFVITNASSAISRPRSGHGTGFTSGPAMQAILQFIADPTRRPTYSLASLMRRNFYLTRAGGTSLRGRSAPELPDPEADVFLPLP